MWIMTPEGFFSIVAGMHEDGTTMDDTLVVRARQKDHLTIVSRLYKLGPVSSKDGTDYPYRCVAPKTNVVKMITALADGIDYTNFKSEVSRVRPKDHKYKKFLHDVWAIGYEMGPRRLVNSLRGM